MKRLFTTLFLLIAVITIIFLIFGDSKLFQPEFLKSYSDNFYTFSILSFLLLSLDILLPIPSSIVMYINGAVLGFINGFFISLSSLMVTHLLGYQLGRFSSIIVRGEDIGRAQSIINSYGIMGIMLSRGIPVLAEGVSIMAGHYKLSFNKFMFYNLLGLLPVCAIYTYFGSLAKNGNLFVITLGVTTLVAGMMWLIRMKIVRKPTVDQS